MMILVVSINFCASTVQTKTEYKTRRTAIRVLLKYCRVNDIDVSNLIKFCERFGIPTEYKYIVSLPDHPTFKE